MENLFTTDFEINGKTELFNVTFFNDQYQFKAVNGTLSFNIKREDDEWHTETALNNQMKDVAIEKLEAYLLSQH